MRVVLKILTAKCKVRVYVFYINLILTLSTILSFFFLQKANLEIQFPPEIAGAEEFKAGPGDTATLSFKVRAFPGADSSWFLLEPPEEEVT